MKKLTLFNKLILFVLGACVLLGVLSTLIFFFFGMKTFGNEIERELVPRTRQVVRLTRRYLEGKISYDTYASMFSFDVSRGSHVYVFDDQGNLVIYASDQEEGEDRIQQICQPYISRIFSSGEELSDTNITKVGGVLIGIPILDNLDRVAGAVIAIKPARQLRTGMVSMTYVLIAGIAGVMLILLVASYFLSGKISKPISEMVNAARQMAAGDYSVRVNTDAGPEIAQLGGALNYLAEQLSETVTQLTEARNQLNTILDGVTEGILALDENAEHITYANHAANGLIDIECFPPAEGSEYHAGFRECVEKLHAGDKTAEMTMVCGGRTMQITLNGNPDHSDAGKDTYIVLVRDITEAERLEQTRRDYVANVSHELRTPIASIRSLAETLNDGMVKDDSERYRYYSHILRESTRLTRLINDLLELSRLQSGNVALNKTEFQLKDLISDICDRMRNVADYSDISLNFDGAPDDLVFSNRDRIEQVTLSLVDNAVKYCTDGGTVDVWAEDGGDLMKVFVWNTGKVDPVDLPHLFERFYKADKAHSGSGTGLGLAIAQEILTLLGETISVENRDGCVVFSFTVHKR
ncbi:MAG: cell wall metabolism sensor histidine kinase WalK [Clostridiales bacterium]|nr:cell wall metabolism sensor histidine kinase WalK [Clostridiales bacterium]